MRSIRDIQTLLFSGYAFGYLLAVLAPIIIDPILDSHALFGPRRYPYEKLCILIYILLLGTQVILFKRTKNIISLYISVIIFITAMLFTQPIFLPEFPHGNLFAVGATTAFLSAFTVFVWSICDRMSKDSRSITSTGEATFEYLKTLLTFVRQGAFAGVTLFGVLFFAAFSTLFKYTEAVVTSKHDIFLINVNISVQMAFYTTYCVAGAVRYFFVLNLEILSKFKDIAIQLDRDGGKHRVRKKHV
jgi:hypothetical protein